MAADSMSLRDMLFWVFLTLFGTGTYVIYGSQSTTGQALGIAMILVGLAGMISCAWPHLKDPVSGKIKLTRERLRRFVNIRIIGYTVGIALLVSIGFRVYRHYYPAFVQLPPNAMAPLPRQVEGHQDEAPNSSEDGDRIQPDSVDQTEQRQIVQDIVEKYRNANSLAVPSETWINQELQRKGVDFRCALNNPTPDARNQLHCQIYYLPITQERRDKIIHDLLVEYTNAHPEERESLLDGKGRLGITPSAPIDWLNERLRQEGYFSFQAKFTAPDQTKPPVAFENSGSASGITVLGGGARNNAGGVMNNATLDLRPWFDYLLKVSSSREEIDEAIKQKHAELTQHWSDPSLSSKERLKQMDDFHQIERLLGAALGDPKKMEVLLKKLRNETSTDSPQ
jgi:hypothetical protein